jgi:hypothetical protein
MDNHHPVTTCSESQIYKVPEIAALLQISVREAYLLCGSTHDFRVYRFGRSLRINKASFDDWFHGECPRNDPGTYTVDQVAEQLRLSASCLYLMLKSTTDFRVLCFRRNVRIHKQSFDLWFKQA